MTDKNQLTQRHLHWHWTKISLKIFRLIHTEWYKTMITRITTIRNHSHFCSRCESKFQQLSEVKTIRIVFCIVAGQFHHGDVFVYWVGAISDIFNMSRFTVLLRRYEQQAWKKSNNLHLEGYSTIWM